MLRKTLMLMLLFCLPACGFHLRGSAEFPEDLKVIYIQAANQRGELVRQLSKALRASGVSLVEFSTEAATTLSLREDTGRRTLSVGTDSKALEYEVYYNVKFKIDSVESDLEVPEQSITLTRDYLFDRFGVLAAGEEEAELRKDMQQELARLIIDRISAFSLRVKSDSQ